MMEDDASTAPPEAPRSTRTRRRTAKAVDYAKDFSDDDLLEEDEKPVRSSSQPSVNGDSSRRKSRSVRKPAVATVQSGMAFQDDELDDYSGRKLTGPVFSEPGYDPNELPIREKYTFEPEYEADGSPKVELIIGRRLIGSAHGEQGELNKWGSPKSSERKSRSGASDVASGVSHTDYEYLIKYRGRSYLHLEWKKATELESLNKSGKTLYRRFLKKLDQGLEEGLEDPSFDPTYAEPQKIVDQKECEIMVELNDKELLEWQKEEKEREEKESDNDSDEDENSKNPAKATPMEEDKDDDEEEDNAPVPNKRTDPVGFKLFNLRKLLAKDPYYPRVKGSNNPYRDGYIDHAPKKPRPAYLIFQHTTRPEFQKKHAGKSVADIMSLLGEAWHNTSEEDREPYVVLAQEEAEQYNAQLVLLEKAQRPTDVWQPMRRCLIVLERLAQDPYADIFLEPVDTNDFPDYEDIVDTPMDIGTVRDKLVYKKYPYQAPEMFARDMRKIWNNCKIYNQHGSVIWHVADYMSKQFERLYQAWVIAFRERHLRWVVPIARPWETTCRQCDGKCGTVDDKMIVCDHCDSMYGMKCLRPPLTKLPSGIWHCPECNKAQDKSRLLSALSEQASRKRVELGEIPKKKVIKKLFLVKWAGLGYEFCTWEDPADLNDDDLLNEYYGLSNMVPDEPNLTHLELDELYKNIEHETNETAPGVENMPELRTRLYAMTRAFHFFKFARNIPQNLAMECGPHMKTHALIANSNDSKDESISDVIEAAQSISFHIAGGETWKAVTNTLPQLLNGEYDTIVPVTDKGLMMNVGEMGGAVSFLGYREFPDGSKGPAEIKNLIHSVGDKIIAVNGMSTVNKNFKEVISMLREAGKNQFAHMRFLKSKVNLPDNSLSSVGEGGLFMVDDLLKKFKIDRRQVLNKRAKQLELEAIEAAANAGEESDQSVTGEDEGDSESESSSDGEYDEASDDEDILKQKSALELAGGNGGQKPVKSDRVINSIEKNEKEDNVEYNMRETTRSLGLRLLDIDLGYSSDEGGDEECAFYVDGVDKDFTTFKEAIEQNKGKEIAPSPPEECFESSPDLPAKRNEYTALGKRSKTCASILLSHKEPDTKDFEHYPQVVQTKEDATKVVDKKTKKKKSTTKIEQIDPRSNEVVRIWENVQTAASTLQIQGNDIRQLLSGIYDESLGDEVGGYRWRYADEDAEVTLLLSDLDGHQKGKKAFLEFRDKLYDPRKPHLYKNNNSLRDYQVDGVNWLASCWYKRHGAILADEMGLGKTVQIVTYIEHLFRVENIKRPYLVVVPLSTVEHWRREFEGWTELRCCVYHDRQRQWRDVMREYEWYYPDRPHTFEYLKFDVLVTTYDTLIADFDVVSLIPWRVTVVDEAHRLRNLKGKLLECMKFISQKGTLEYGFQSRVLMTGTPLQNNTQELWTLLNFIEPNQFPSLEEFEVAFANIANREQVEALQNKISPFMLRRVKEDVAKDIPAKEETLIDVELTAVQKQYYRAIFENNHAFLSMGTTRATAPKLMNIQMELRKCCNHPFLLDTIENREMDRYRAELSDSGAFRGKTYDEQQIILNEHGYIKSSGKMVLLDKLLPKLREEGHKVLIFSQMVRMLDLISEFCEFRGFKFERLDGRIRGNERQKAIDRFNTEEDSFVFLLSTRAGGVGINLTAADICIIFDSDWNPQNDIQAQARCHRIGQTKDVMIYRLITSRTFEQEMFDRASLKLGLEQAVLGTFDKEDDDGKPTHKEMEQLLKKGAYALLQDDDHIEKEFQEDNIESILAKRTRTRVVEGVKTSSWLNKAGFSKTKFTGDGEASGVHVDDPDFWKKVMPDFVTPQIMIDKLEELTDEVEKIVNSSDEDEEMTEQEQKKRRRKRKGDEKKIDEMTNKFMADLSSMMDDIYEKVEDENLPQADKEACQKLLFTISIKEKIFSDDQVELAQAMLARIEGDRRRRCRTSEVPDKASGRSHSGRGSSIPDQLRILSKHKQRQQRRQEKQREKDEVAEKREGVLVDDDGYLRHSDSEGDWSDVGDDPYGLTRKRGISRKDLSKRVSWASDKDPLVAAGRPWPALPRDVVKKVLISMIDDVIKQDDEAGGIFSVPVPRDEFPEYYEIISSPMDYGTMKDKLAKGEYRSALAMQKDFQKVMANCLTFNAPDSDIVKEAQRQALSIPGHLKAAALKHNLFLAEDGSVLEIYSDDEEDDDDDKPVRKRNRKRRCGNCDACKRKECGECSACKAKKKFGGDGLTRRPCEQKVCENMVYAFGAPRSDEMNTNGQCSVLESVGSLSKTRKRRQSENLVDESNVKKRRLRSNNDDTNEEDDEMDEDEVVEPIKEVSVNEITNGTSNPDHIVSPVEDQNDSLDFDLDEIVSKRKSLDGSVESAREFFTSRGPWVLPSFMESKFDEVAELILGKMMKHDDYDLFANEVTEEEAPGYFKVVENPMDFSKIGAKIKSKDYGCNSDSIKLLYHDFLLTMDNCNLYNESDSEVGVEGGRLMSLLPEVFAESCISVFESGKN